MKHRRLIFSVALLILLTGLEIGAQPQYTVTDLGAFRPRDIANGWAVGSVREGGGDLPARLNLATMQPTILG